MDRCWTEGVLGCDCCRSGFPALCFQELGRLGDLVSGLSNEPYGLVMACSDALRGILSGPTKSADHHKHAAAAPRGVLGPHCRHGGNARADDVRSLFASQVLMNEEFYLGGLVAWRLLCLASIFSIEDV